jgi:flagellin
MAMNAYRNYNNNTSALSSNLEKLSSGYKINRAGDDAAGLAISEKMRAQISGLDQASSNVKDGISLVKTGEGALQEVQDMLNRMVTLATQSANGTYDNDTDRAQLQKEVDSLTEEIDRIADSANFNGIQLLDGSLDTGSILADYKSLDTSAIKKLMLTQSDTNAVSDVGKATILETDASDIDYPSFTVSFDGVSHVVTDGTGSSTNLTLDIGGQKILLDETKLGTAGTKATGKDIAAAFLAEGVSDTTGGGTATDVYDKSSNTFKDANGNEWSVTQDGDKLKFTFAGDLENKISTDGALNEHFDVSLTPVTGKHQDPTGATYTVGITTVGATKGAGTDQSKTTATVTATIDGQTVTFTAKNLSDAADETVLSAATYVDQNGNDLSDYFTISKDTTNHALIFTDKTTGSTGSGNTINSVTCATDNTGFNATAMSTTVDKEDGLDAYSDGTSGYLNAASEVNIQVDKVPVDQLASTTLDLGGKLLDGTQIKLGNTTYTIALGEDSNYKGADNVVYLNDAKATDEQIASKLTEVAKGNDVFSVGHAAGTDGKITLKQLSSAKEKTEMKTMDEFASYIGVSQVSNSEDDPVTVGKALKLQIGDTSDSYNQLAVKIEDMHAEALGIADIDISTQEGASSAINVIKAAINQVSSTRGTLGATQNRLEHTQNNLSVMSENIQDAESTIRDTDIAEEMMSYTKNNILVQSAQAMLAQANSVPQGVLQLLQ